MREELGAIDSGNRITCCALQRRLGAWAARSSFESGVALNDESRECERLVSAGHVFVMPGREIISLHRLVLPWLAAVSLQSPKSVTGLQRDARSDQRTRPHTQIGDCLGCPALCSFLSTRKVGRVLCDDDNLGELSHDTMITTATLLLPRGGERCHQTDVVST